MVTTQHKKILIKGLKGDTGDNGTDTTVPQAGIIAYKGDTIPEGYILYSEVPDGVLTHITATYTQTATITDTSSLDDLRPDLVVKAYYYDAETGITSDYVITDYTLSGTLEVGTSTITASYNGFSDSFDVTVSAGNIYEWDFTESLIDKCKGQEAILTNATFTQGVGVTINALSNYCTLFNNESFTNGITIEVDYSICNKSYNSTLALLYSNIGQIVYRNTNKWAVSKGGYIDTSETNANVFDGKTLKMVLTDSNTMSIYSNDVLIYSGISIIGATDTLTTLMLGTNQFNSFYKQVITGVRIYANQ